MTATTEGATRAVRHHSSDDMDGLRELAGISAPVAVVIRPDGSADVYGDVGVVDRRPSAESPATCGHALIVERQGETVTARCQCGEPFGQGNPAGMDHAGLAWEHHMKTEASR